MRCIGCFAGAFDSEKQQQLVATICSGMKGFREQSAGTRDESNDAFAGSNGQIGDERLNDMGSRVIFFGRHAALLSRKGPNVGDLISAIGAETL
jgi:hypothetical protein